MAEFKELTDNQKRFCEEYIIDLNGTKAAIRAGIELKTIGEGYYVYFLINSKSGKIKYIGKGKDERMHDHFREFKKGKLCSAEKFKAYEEAMMMGAQLIPFVFYDDLTESQAYTMERELIFALRNYGLCNIQNGVVTNEEREKAAAKQLLNRVIPIERWKAERSRTDNEIEMYYKVVSNLQAVLNH